MTGKKPRHAKLADGLATIRAYMNRPEGEPVPLQTNWQTSVSNDNSDTFERGNFGVERGLRARPTIQRIMEAVESGDVERAQPTEMEIERNGQTIVVSVPGQIIRIGRLRFSNGSQIERGYKIGPDGDAVGTELRMTTGAMLGTSEEMERTLGRADNPSEVAASNAYFNRMFGVEKMQRVPMQRGKRSLDGKNRTHAERVAMLVDAYANTPELPPITKCPPGLPIAGSKIADSFVGMQKAGKGDTGSTAWESIATALVDREIWAQALDELSGRDRKTLDVVAHGRVQNMAEIEPGGHKRTAERRGSRLLRAANDNLASILQKAAA